MFTVLDNTAANRESFHYASEHKNALKTLSLHEPTQFHSNQTFTILNNTDDFVSQFHYLNLHNYMLRLL